MNFFSHQDKARSSTRKLVFLFLCAVATLIVVTSFLVIAVLFYADAQSEGGLGLNSRFLTSQIFLFVSLGVIAVVALGSLFRMAQLRGGGKSVAEALGGRLLNTNTRDADERKILNVVEEIAIASGTPVPPVYLMEDPAINAFAAGYKPQDAVIGITRGCIHELSRDELQGVVAHEFSHIFNGDMRLNIRLMGLLYGIMVLGMIGYFLMRGNMYRSFGGHRGGKGKNQGIIFLAIGLIVIGYGGTFFGNIIKAAVSRQREFLADASAVQFTRNPDGIAGALKKIGGYKHGSRIESTDASEISHMLFSEGLKKSFTGMFSTHPPLGERIKRIDPNWDGKVAYSEPGKSFTAEGVAHFGGPAAQAGSSSAGGSAIEAIGEPGAAHVELAVNQLGRIPGQIRDEAHSTLGASVLMYCLLLELSDQGTAGKQVEILTRNLEPAHFKALEAVWEQVRGLERELFLPLVDLSLPSLKQLSENQYVAFMSLLGQLIQADDTISVFEWCLFKILRYSLDDRPNRRQRAIDIKALAKECEVLLSVLAAAGNDDKAAAALAFDRARDYLSLATPLAYQGQLKGDTGALENALDRLNDLKPLQKPLLLKAMVRCITADGKVTPKESELLRAVGTLLDCPIPPLLPDQRFD